MLTLSKALTSAQAKVYYQKDFSNGAGNYYSQGQTVTGEWQGQLARAWGLEGEVTAEQYNRLADGQHPHSGEQLIQHHQKAANSQSPTQEHRAGWDATFSAPKSVSLTALVGGDTRILEAHRESVREALGELERFTQARIGGNHPPENTGKLIIATFEHDSARPVEGYPAPQLHTHAVIFNLTETEEGEARPLQPLELFKSQQYATAVYQSHLADKLQRLGYLIEAGTNGAPEIKGYTKEYLEANSLRSQQIKEHIERYHYERYQQQEVDRYIGSHPKPYQQQLEARRKDLAGKALEEPKLSERAAREIRQELLEQLTLQTFDEFRSRRVFDYTAGEAQLAAHRTREHKVELSQEEVHARHLEVAKTHGNQPQRIVGEAEARGPIEHDPAEIDIKARQSMAYARERNQEREAVNDEREILRDALRRGLGVAIPDKVKETLEAHLAKGAFIRVAHYNRHSPARAFTTPETLALERANIEKVLSSQGKYDRLVGEEQIPKERFDPLNSGQRSAVEKILASRDQIVALNGKAGTGKTTTLAVVREATERQGYQVEGFAPTTRAAKLLEESGIHSSTLQKFLTRQADVSEQPHLFVLDESSLASTRQVHQFFSRLGETDRVLLVGDARQHQAIEAGRPFEQFLKAGISTADLNELLRQRDPELKAVVELLADGAVKSALDRLQGQGRIHSIPDLSPGEQQERLVPANHDRLQAIAQDFLSQADNTLVIAPDNRARASLNLLIHQELQRAGKVSPEERSVPVLINRQELAGADRQWASQYQVGDWIRYSRGSSNLKIKPNEYVLVLQVNSGTNTLTVERTNGESLSYDPRRLQGVTVYQEGQRSFAPGDRIQFTAPHREQQIANRELGTLREINSQGRLVLQLDSGRPVQLEAAESRHLDYGYAVTSHSSQGQTVDRALVYIDTEQTSALVLNSRLAYVAVSRARHDVRIYTNDTDKLAEALSRQTSKSSALEAWQKGEGHDQSRHLPPPSLTPAAAHEVKLDPNRELALSFQR
jgi:conjugative relaxase-like TrwC/TraI family protein